MKEYISVLIKGVGKSSFVCNYHKCLGYYHGEINIGKKCNVTSLPALGRPTLTQMPSWTCRSARSPFWCFRINIYDLINSIFISLLAKSLYLMGYILPCFRALTIWGFSICFTWKLCWPAVWAASCATFDLGNETSTSSPFLLLFHLYCFWPFKWRKIQWIKKLCMCIYVHLDPKTKKKK